MSADAPGDETESGNGKAPADTTEHRFSFFGSQSEAERLHNQHHLTVNAFGRLLLCPVDLSHENVRVLDSGTADGFWLRELRKQLPHAESARLIGTDIVPYPQFEPLPENITVIQHDMMQEYPAEWEGTFDLVHQRACATFYPNWEKAVEAIRQMIRLLKPGGWIQLIDTSMPTGPVEPFDTAATNFMRQVGNSCAALGLNSYIGSRLQRLIRDAGGKRIGGRTATVWLGAGAETKELENMGYAELEKMAALVMMAIEKMPNHPGRNANFPKLTEGMMEEARTEGVNWVFHCAWAQKPLES